QPQERAVLNHTVRIRFIERTTGSRQCSIGIARRPAIPVRCELVGVVFVTRLHNQSIGIQNIISIRPLKKYTQIKSLIHKVVGPSSKMLGQWVTNDYLVILIDQPVAI